LQNSEKSFVDAGLFLALAPNDQVAGQHKLCGQAATAMQTKFLG